MMGEVEDVMAIVLDIDLDFVLLKVGIDAILKTEKKGQSSREA